LNDLVHVLPCRPEVHALIVLQQALSQLSNAVRGLMLKVNPDSFRFSVLLTAETLTDIERERQAVIAEIEELRRM